MSLELDIGNGIGIGDIGIQPPPLEIPGLLGDTMPHPSHWITWCQY